MNKILSFFILSVFLIVSSSHNIFMVFSDSNNFMESIHKMEKKDHCSEKSEDNKCILKCIKKIELEKNTFLAISENNSSNNKIKFSQIILDLDFHTLDFKDKSSLKINSPPWIYHKISTNYSYHNLIKIIKSNT